MDALNELRCIVNELKEQIEALEGKSRRQQRHDRLISGSD